MGLRQHAIPADRATAGWAGVLGRATTGRWHRVSLFETLRLFVGNRACNAASCPACNAWSCPDRFILGTWRLLPQRAKLEEPNIHLNPVRAALVKRAEGCPWSSALDHSGSLNAGVTANRIPAIDRGLSPMNGHESLGRAGSADSRLPESLRLCPRIYALQHNGTAADEAEAGSAESRCLRLCGSS